MSAGRALLIIDGDDILRRALRDQLIVAEPFAVVDEAGTGAAALEQAQSRTYDLFLIDVGLPDQNGWKVCSALRQCGVRAPIIMMTTAAADGDPIAGLDAGATDYVAKPFRMAALLARVHDHLRHQDQSDAAVLVIGPYKFQPAAKMLSMSGSDRKIRLTEKETAILRYLYRIGNKTVSRETLLGEVWGYNAAVTTHTLETHVYRLRQKIEADPQQAQLLVTEAGGYRLNP
ncbi:MAG: response regulator transcription factor [Rhodospirillaceae bacterium]|nr:MAG: response regulator transcription factor [Rhodospirillaceae bacterium]